MLANREVQENGCTATSSKHEPDVKLDFLSKLSGPIVGEGLGVSPLWVEPERNLSFFLVSTRIFRTSHLVGFSFSFWIAFLHHIPLAMSSCALFSRISSLGRRSERSDDGCTAPTLERRLELFEWVHGYRAIKGSVFGRILQKGCDPASEHHPYSTYRATMSDLSTRDLSQFKLTPPSQVEIELVQAVTDYLGRKRRRADGW